MTTMMMKFFVTVCAILGVAEAFAPSRTPTSSSTSTSLKAYSDPKSLPGAILPLGFFDPLGFSDCDIDTLKRYREAEIVHGRAGMLAVVGILVGEQVTGWNTLFNKEISGPAITHLKQLPVEVLALMVIIIGTIEIDRANVGFVEPDRAPFPGVLRKTYEPGNVGFDPLGLKPRRGSELYIMQTKEIQNGRLAMLAAAGMMAQETVDGQGILEHLQL